MDQSTLDIRDRILQSLLPEIAFDGWTWRGAEQAAVRAGFDSAMAAAVFAGGLGEVLDHFSDWADRQALAALSPTDAPALRVRDRIEAAVSARLDVLEPWKEAVRLATRFWSVPSRAPRAAKLVWRTADRIWLWAGDEARDYNRYTKRILLAGVLGSTMMAWLSDREEGLDATRAFLHRRIDNVMSVGRALGKMRKTG